MRIEHHPARLVIVSSASTPAAARSFAVLLHEPQFLHASDAQMLLASAWGAVVGSAPSPKTSALLSAHWSLETDGGRAMPGHNFAGIKAGPSAAGATYHTLEGYGATRHEVRARFRVYESAEAGAHDYVRLLKTRYPAALEAARSGDSAGFARALAAGGYFTADPQAYAQGLKQRLAELAGHTARATLAQPTQGQAQRVLAEAALSGLLHAFHEPREDTEAT